jgi:chromosome segregation ATPase
MADTDKVIGGIFWKKNADGTLSISADNENWITYDCKTKANKSTLITDLSGQLNPAGKDYFNELKTKLGAGGGADCSSIQTQLDTVNAELVGKSADVTDLQKKIADLEEEKIKLEADISALTLESPDKADGLKIVQNKLDDIIKQKDELQKQLDDCLDGKTPLETKIAELEAQLKSATDSNSTDIAAEVAELKSKLDAANAEAAKVAELQTQLDAANAEAAKVADLQTQLDIANAEAANVVGLQAQLVAANAEAAKVAGLQSQLDAAKAEADKVAGLQTQLDAANLEAAKIADLQTQLVAANAEVSKIAGLQEQLNTANSSRASIESEKNKAIAELNVELNTAEKYKQSLESKGIAQKQCSEALDKVAKLEGTIAALTADKVAAENAKDAALADIGRLTIEKDTAITATMASKAAELAQLTKEKDAAIAERDTANAKIKEANNAFQNAITQRRQALLDVEATKKQIDSYIAALKSKGNSEKECADAIANIATLNQQINGIKAELEEASRNLEANKRELEQEKAKCATLTATQSQLDKATIDLKQANEEKQLIQKSLDAANVAMKDHGAAQEECAKALEELGAANKKIREIEPILVAKTAELDTLQQAKTQVDVQLARVIDENAKFNATVEDLRKKLDNCNSELGKYKSEKAECLRLKEELNKLRPLTEENTKIKEQLEVAQTSLKDLDVTKSELVELQEQLKNSEAINSELSKSKLELTQQLDASKQALANGTDKQKVCADIITQLGQEKEKANKLEQDLANSQASKKQLETQLSDFKANIGANDAALKAATKQNLEKDTKINGLTTELTQVNTKLSKLQEKMKTITSAAAERQSKLGKTYLDAAQEGDERRRVVSVSPDTPPPPPGPMPTMPPMPPQPQVRRPSSASSTSSSRSRPTTPQPKPAFRVGGPSVLNKSPLGSYVSGVGQPKRGGYSKKIRRSKKNRTLKK